MEVKINREIRNYTESMFFGLSMRQCVFTVLAASVAILLYFVLKPYVGTETVSWMCILGAAPVSYTHLDVYKRQRSRFSMLIMRYLPAQSYKSPKRDVYKRQHQGLPVLGVRLCDLVC